MHKRIPLVAVIAAVALTAMARSASALSLGVGSGATLTPLRPGQTATGAGSLTVISLTPWTLTVHDGGSGAGRMVKAVGGCTGSDAQLTNALTVTVTGSGVTSSGSKTLSSTPTQVANGPLTALSNLTTSYSQVVPAAQVMLTGCVYTLTATYTLQ